MKPSLYKYIFAIIFIAGCLAASGQEKQDKQLLQDMQLLSKISTLYYQGKLNEALPLIIKKTSELKQRSDRSKEAFGNYLMYLQFEALAYQQTGNYLKSEQLFKLILNLQHKLTDDSRKSQRRGTMILISKLYETMNNDDAAQRILEEQILSEYEFESERTGGPDKKTFFFNYFITYFNWGANGARKGTKLEDELEKIKNHPKVLKSSNQAYIQRLWRAYNTPAVETEMSQMSLSVMFMGFESFFSLSKKNTTLTDDAYQKLRNGTLKLSGGRDETNFTEPWGLLQRLFKLYLKNGNQTAAEALMEQVVNIDRSPGKSKKLNVRQFTRSMLSAPTVNMMVKEMGISRDMFDGLNQMMESNKSYGGVDIYLIENQALLARLYKQTGRDGAFDEMADQIDHNAQKLQHEKNPIIINSLANSYMLIEKYESAAKLYHQFLTYHQRQQTKGTLASYLMYLTALQNLSKINVIRGDFDHAENYLTQALNHDINNKAETSPGHLERVIQMAQLYETAGRLTKAEAYCSSVLEPVMQHVRNNFAFLSEPEKIGLLTKNIDAFDLSASLMITNPNHSKSFEMKVFDQQQQLKGMILNDERRIYNNIRKNGSPQLKQLMNSWQKSKEAIAWQSTRPRTPRVTRLKDSLAAVANDQEKRINLISSSFNQTAQQQNVSFANIRQGLNNDEAAIEFVKFRYFHKHWTDSVYYAAFVITANKATPHFVPLCEESALAQVLDAANSGEDAEDFYNKIYGVNHKTLYKLVWEPVQPFLKNVAKVNVAPAGLLNRVAFSALRGNGVYLTDLFQMTQITGVKQLAQKTGNSALKVNEAILFGNINYGHVEGAPILETDSLTNERPAPYQGSYWGPLPSSTPGIAALFTHARLNARLFTDTAATEDKLKKLSGRSPDVLYISTHGFSKPGISSQINGDTLLIGNSFSLASNPMFRSGILMAGANRVWSGGQQTNGKEDGIVTAYEISNLDLSQTNLVVLGACQTALGDIKGTEGVFGLQRAFKIAGVKYMVLSLWDLPLIQTNLFMKSFFGYLIREVGINKAFSLAQQAVRENNKLPYYWAGFVLIE